MNTFEYVEVAAELFTRGVFVGSFCLLNLQGDLGKFLCLARFQS